MSTGSTSSIGVPVSPCCSKERPPNTSSPPPRAATNAAVSWSWARLKNDASTLPKTTASYWKRSARTSGKPEARPAARDAAACTKKVGRPSSVTPLRTTESTSRLVSCASARLRNVCS